MAYPRKRDTSGLPIRCYDNGGTRNETIDRYTVVYLSTQHRDHLGRPVYDSVGMNGSPFHPQGFGQHGECTLGKHLGREIQFSQLPSDCRKLVKQDLRD